MCLLFAYLIHSIWSLYCEPLRLSLWLQGGPHIGSEYNGQVGTSMQAERGGHWATGLPERGSGGPHLPGPHPLAPGQLLPGLGGGQQPRPPPVILLAISISGYMHMTSRLCNWFLFSILSLLFVISWLLKWRRPCSSKSWAWRQSR